MQSTCKNRTLQWITKQLDNGNISLSHKFQRKEGQWNKQTKSELIDSLLREYPINPTYGVKDGNVISLIDGVQRISTVRDYITDAFALSKTLEPVIINVNTDDNVVHQEVIIAGKKFSQLDESIQEILLASELQIYTITDYTEKDIREMFRRQNAGKALNSTQLRTVVESDEMSDLIFSLTTHQFFTKVLTEAQRRKDLEKDILVETLMLMETNKENDYTSFKSKDINTFITMYQENINYEEIELLKSALNKLDESFEEIKVKQLSVPMIIFGMYRIIKDKKSTERYIEWVKNFIETYDTNEEYLQYCGSGTNSSAMVKGRLDYFRNAIRNLQ